MKKIIPAISIILLLLLSACSSTASATESSDPSASSTLVADLVNQNLTSSAPAVPQTSSEAETVQLTTDYTDAVSTEMQLLLGSMKLEGTAQAITAEQAKLLLPLWTNFKTLSQSMMPTQGDMGQGQPNSTPQPQTVDTEAQTQIDALSKQIQSSMTAEQINAITAMQITQDSARTTMQELGLSMGGPQQGGDASQPPQGDMPQGTPPAGGPGGQPPSGDQMGTPPTGGGQGNMGFISQELVDALIKLLGQKAGL